MARRKPLRRDEGFTLIEILVVMLILGILAAIALPNFLGQNEKAQDAEAQSLARNLQTQVQACFVDTDDYSRCDSAAEVPKTGLSWGSGAGQVQVLMRPYGQDLVAFTATSKTGTIFAIFRGLGDGSTGRACFVPSNAYPTGACRQGGPYAGMGFGTW